MQLGLLRLGASLFLVAIYHEGDSAEGKNDNGYANAGPNLHRDAGFST